jgi:hypothetical protein
MERRKWEVHEEGKLWKVKVNKDEHNTEAKKKKINKEKK